MEANITGETRGFYGTGGTDLNGIGRRKGIEWDLNDWSWDGDLFVATPVNAVSSDCRNKQLIPIPVNGEFSGNSHGKEIGLNGNGKVDLEKRRRIAVVEEVDEPELEEAAPFTLRLGRQVYPIPEPADCEDGDGNNSKRSKLQASNSNRGVCQVEGCGADLSDAKDYHRRHKVCEMHAKASKALVANVMQRFCQQCSRFHHLQEFDEGKRSCRRRLAGHNRRRRKTHPDAITTETSLIDTQATSYILISLLRILSNLQSNTSEQSKQQDLLTHFLSSLANLVGSVDARKLSAFLEASQNQEKIGTAAGTSAEAAHLNQTSNGVTQPESNVPGSAEAANESHIQRAEPHAERFGVRNFDLNDIYNDGQINEEPEMDENTRTLNIGSPNCPPWLLQNPHHQSPPQTSGTSNSASDDSLGSSNGDGHRTGRIVFKLFGKDPNDFPLDLRRQIIGWLSSTPTDIESYIRPGCIILTVYLRLAESKWEELCHDPKSSLRRLFDLTDDYFWKSGWVYVRWQHLMAFVYNGHTVLDAPLPVDSHKQSKILIVSPVAVPFSARINFTVKGFDLIGHTERLLCAFDGKYLVQQATHSLVDGAVHSNNLFQCLRFSCDTPSVMGRGFVEIEDHGLGGASFPFIVAEPEICSEICSLESTIDRPCPQQNFVDGSPVAIARARALDFLEEMGWLLHNCQLMSKAADIDSDLNLFSLSRFKWLIVFSMEHAWCAVVKKLLDIFVEGSVDLGGRTPKDALKEVAPLHHAVRCNYKSMVELLLKYKPEKSAGYNGSKKGVGTAGFDHFLFQPDMAEVGDVTPLHLAASRADALDVLDALTDDPGQVGITAWKTAKDSSGLTPEDYARSKGLVSYLHLVERKIHEKSGSGHVVDIPLEALHASSARTGSTNMAALIHRSMPQRNQQSNCKICSRQQLAYINRHRSSMLYRPAMLSLVGIAAVCVCVALLLKGPPDVRFVLVPFRWEALEFGVS